jgi:hypothetical protein
MTDESSTSSGFRPERGPGPLTTTELVPDPRVARAGFCAPSILSRGFE